MSVAAIVLAAGLGKRMKSSKAKVAHEILGKPLINYCTSALKDAGAEKIICVLGHQAEQIEPLVSDACGIAIQKSRLGTADAVLSALPNLKNFKGSILVTYGDCPLITSETLKKLVDIQQKENCALSLLTANLENPYGYGRIVRDKNGNILKNVEEKNATDEEKQIRECNAGFYCFDSDELFEHLRKIKKNETTGEFYLTDIIEILINNNKKVVGIQLNDPNETIGINDQVQLHTASKIMQKCINEMHMKRGIQIVDSNSTYISPDATIESDVVIWQNSMIFGKSSVASGSVIGPNTRLYTTTVGKNCTIDETIAYDSVIENGATCGPRCYLRPETHLCENSKVGTSVEIKKSTVGKNSKVPHLSYIGDAIIESDVNLGAGTITCNYDGEKKHKTTIGKNSFVGSSTMLVAPVNIGKNALIGAGSVITDDVPDNCLSLGRARQVNKENRNCKQCEN